MKIKTILSSVFLSTVCLVSAQNQTDLEPLVSDRPDQTESPNVMRKGFLQIETGAGIETFEEGTTKTENFTINTTLLRYGLLDNLELRIGWDLVDGTLKNNGNTIDITSGFSPLLLGAKIGVTEEKGWLPKIGFLGHLALPFTASSDYKPETTGVDFRFSFAHTLSEKSSLAYNLGAAWGDDSSEAAYVYTLVYGYRYFGQVGCLY